MENPSNDLPDSSNRDISQIDITQQIYFNRNNQDTTIEFKLLQNLEKLWRNEKFCKDLLKFNEDIVSEIIEKLEKRVKINLKKGKSNKKY